LRALREELARQPHRLDLAVEIARRYTELGRVKGDPRFAGYAQAALANWWEQPEPPSEVLLLRATLRQRNHDFDAALLDLATLIRRNPRDGQARLTRATILQVQGDYAAAAAECTALRRLAPELVWAACSYGLASVNGRLAREL
jgi:predicted Zn-dependent protease